MPLAFNRRRQLLYLRCSSLGCDWLAGGQFAGLVNDSHIYVFKTSSSKVDSALLTRFHLYQAGSRNRPRDYSKPITRSALANVAPSPAKTGPRAAGKGGKYRRRGQPPAQGCANSLELLPNILLLFRRQPEQNGLATNGHEYARISSPDRFISTGGLQ